MKGGLVQIGHLFDTLNRYLQININGFISFAQQ